jgi:hypothetical protein
MKKTYIAPLKIEIPDFNRSIFIDKFRIRRIREIEQRKYLGVSNVKLNDNGNLIGCTHHFQSDSVRDPVLSSMDLLKIQGSQYIIECNVDYYMSKRLSDLLLAFRLYRPGGIYAPLIIHPNKAAIQYVHPLFNEDREKYSVKKQEFREIRRIYNLIICSRNSKLPLISERFNNAIGYRTDQKNSFIDFVTILEAIFLNNAFQELSFRFALYTSFILSNKLGEKVDFNDMKKIYTTRSELVHSGKSKNYNNGTYEKTKQYTRKLLLWYIKKKAKTNMAIDEMILKELKIQKPNNSMQRI